VTKKQESYKASLIKAVHTSQTYIDIYSKDRELYADMLFNNFGVRSSKNLSIDELKKLVLFLNSTGFLKYDFLKTTISKNQCAFLTVLWKQKSRTKDEKSLLNLIKSRFKISLNSVYDLEKKDFKKIVAVLKNISIGFEDSVEFSKSKLRFSLARNKT